MDDKKFVAIVNDACEASRLDPSAPPDPTDPAYIEAWAGFVRACVSRGVEVGDRRWSELIVRSEQGRARFRLSDPADAGENTGEPDFGVGLALLMSLLGRSKDSEKT